MAIVHYVISKLPAVLRAAVTPDTFARAIIRRADRSGNSRDETIVGGGRGAHLPIDCIIRRVSGELFPKKKKKTISRTNLF